MTALRTAPMIIPTTHGKVDLFASHCASIITDVTEGVSDSLCVAQKQGADERVVLFLKMQMDTGLFTA